MKAHVENKKITGLNFDDGKKGFPVNGDSNRMIYFNPSDVNLYDRIAKASEDIISALEIIPASLKDEVESGKLETDEAVKTVNLVQRKIKEALNYMLDSDCYDTIFGNTSPLTPVNGEFLINGVMEGLTNLIVAESGKDMEKLNKKLSNYKTK